MKQRKLRVSIENKQYEVLVEDITNETKTFYPYKGLGEEANMTPARAAAPAPAKAAPPSSGGSEAVGDEARVSPLAGIIVSVDVQEGDVVKTGDPVAAVEAMKQKTVIVAHRDGTVTDIAVKEGDPVDAFQRILSIV